MTLEGPLAKRPEYLWMVHPESIPITNAKADWEKVLIFYNADTALDHLSKHSWMRVRKVKISG